MKNTKLLFLTSILLGLLACGNTDNEENTTSEYETTSNETENNDTPDGVSERYNIKTKDGLNIVSFEISNNETTILFEGGNTLIGQRIKENKTRYLDANGDIIAEVKHKDTGFKLKTSDETLLWKVKYKEEKIKISDNEENENSFQVKKKEEGRYKAYDQKENEKGKTKYKDGIVDIDGTGYDLKIPARKNSYAYGMLFFDEIPKAEKYIIMAELLGKGM